MTRLLLAAFALGACGTPPARVPTTTATESARPPLTLTYLGVAGWQIESGGTTILIDPYFSRPQLDAVPIVSDPAAVAAHAPKHAQLILIGHSHIDHLLAAPAVALATGAQIIGSESTAAIARSLGVPDEQRVPIQGGEDYAFGDVSVRVIPSLHSALGDKHTVGGKPATVLPPRAFDDWAEGGTFDYLVRLGGHVVFVSSTANFVEREVEGLRPDVAIVATGLRQEIHDYTCRLLTALGKPPVVFPTHFDDWRHAPVDPPLDDDMRAFFNEVTSCAPGTRVEMPSHFAAITLP